MTTQQQPDWEGFITDLQEQDLVPVLTTFPGVSLALTRFRAFIDNPDGFDGAEDFALMVWNSGKPYLADDVRGDLAKAFHENHIPLVIDEQNQLHIKTSV